MQSGKWIHMFHAIPQIRRLPSIVRHGVVDNCYYGCDTLSNRGRKMIETFSADWICRVLPVTNLVVTASDFAKSNKRFRGESRQSILERLAMYEISGLIYYCSLRS